MGQQADRARFQVMKADEEKKATIIKAEGTERIIWDELKVRCSEFGIFIDDVAITHLNFSPDFEKAVEMKQVAQQQADRARFLVQKADEEKKATIIKAQGTEREAHLIGEAMRDNPGFVELRRIDQAREIAATISKSNNRVILSAETLMLNLMGDKISVADQMRANATPFGGDAASKAA